MRRLLTLIILTGSTLFVLADKAGTPYSFDNPTRFLSRRAIGMMIAVINGG